MRKDALAVARIDEVLEFWFEELAASDWFQGGDALDARIRERFRDLHEALREQVPTTWRVNAQAALAAVVVLDQFPRNMYRGNARAFATDGLALDIARHAIACGFDRELSEVQRKFLYLPFQHSEEKSMQSHSMELFESLGSETDLRYARRHKEIIDRFGRFPHRNEALRRASTPEEIEFLESPGSSF